MKLHSEVDVITNSSAITYIYPQFNYEHKIEKFFNNIFTNSGVDVDFVNLFELDIILDVECSSFLLNNYIDYGVLYANECPSSTIEKETEIIEKFLYSKKITVEDLQEYNNDQIEVLAEQLNILFENALRNNEIKLDGTDGVIPYFSYVSVILKSKITGNILNLNNEFLSIFEMEAQ